MSNLTRRTTLAGLAALPLAGLATTASAATHKIDITGNRFKPKSLTIKAGDTVVWTNSDRADHTATDKGKSWNTGTIGSGGSGQVTFTTKGEFKYFCKVHPSMKATLIVS